MNYKLINKGLGINCVSQVEVLKICRHQQKGLGINCVGQQISGCVKEVFKKSTVIGSKNYLRYVGMSPP